MTIALDFSDVRGNDAAVCALAEAAGSRTGVILTGPPGIAKTMIARRAPGLLGPLADRESAWLLAEYIAIGIATSAATWSDVRPFRAPHHTVSAAAMSGATQPRHRIACPQVRISELVTSITRGQPFRCDCEAHGGKDRVFRPGECHLARFGVLLLDDLIEFPRGVVEAIAATIHGMAPATRPWLIATATPCPCGWHGSGVRECTCPASSLDRWRDRLSRSLRTLEIGANVPVLSVTLADLRSTSPGTSTADLRARTVPRPVEIAS